MTKLRVGDTVFDITPSIGPSSGTAPIQPVTSFGSAAGQFDIDLAGASCSMVILGHAPEAKVIDELVTDLWLLGDFPMRYRIWAVWQDFDEHGDDRISFQGVTYERLLNRRFFGAGGLLLNNTDVGTILWNAIQHTQAKPGGDYGITQGTTTTGITTSVDWLPGENIGARLEEMMKAHGCYWRIDEDKAVHVYVRNKTVPIVEPVMWGVNARSLQRASGGNNFANSVYGSGSPETTPVFVSHSNVATDPRGLWEAAIARPEETIQSELGDAVQGELGIRYQGLSRWNATYVTEHWVGASRIRPGDKATLIVPKTLAGPTTPPDKVQVECVSMSLQFDGDGGVEVRAVLEELPNAASFSVDNTSGDNLNYFRFAAYTPAADSSADTRISCTRKTGWTRFHNGSMFGYWSPTGELRASFYDGTTYPNVTATAASVDAIAAIGEALDIRLRWNAATDTLDVSARPRTGLPLSDDTGWTVLATTVHAAKSIAVRSMSERFGYADVGAEDYTGTYYGARVTTGGTVREITPSDMAWWDGTTSPFVCSTGHDVLINGTVTKSYLDT